MSDPLKMRCVSRLYRCAFTLLELLVVIAIISLMMAMTASAVQRAREAAARTCCQNNLRQLGLALHHFHDGFQRFPPGLTVEKRKAEQPFLSWNARLLPYLEEPALWVEIEQAFRADRDFLTVPPHSRRSEIIPVFLCPTDPRVWVQQPKSAFTSYLGVEGTNQYLHDGVMYLDSRVRLVDILDGASNTLMVGERPPSAALNLGWWYAGWGQAQEGSAEMVLGVREVNVYNEEGCPPSPSHYGPGRFGNQCDTYHFWSPHSVGAHFVFVDGSIRRLAYSLDYIMPALATRAGGETVDSID